MYTISMNEIHYLLGNACNLSCDFCFWDMRIPDVSWDTKLRIIDSIADTDIKKVTISGGEPSINKDFIKVLSEFKKRNIETVVHTNAIKFDTDLLTDVAPLVDRISLSLDGSNEKMCVDMRKDARAYSSVLWLLERISELVIPANVKTLVTGINLADIVNIGKLLDGKQLEYWTLMEFNPVNRGNIFRSKFELSDNDFDKTVEKVRETIKGIEIRTRLFKREPEKYCFIAPNADVYTFIPNKGDILVGNLLKTKLSNIIQKL